MAIAPITPLAAPPTNPAAARYSILDAAVGPLDLPDGGRLADLAYTVPWCGGGTVIDPDCDPPSNDLEDGLGLAEGTAFVVERGFTCLAPGLDEAEVDRIARDRLAGTEHVLVEAKIAEMLASADDIVDLGVTADPAEAVSLLESYAYTIGGTTDTGDPTAAYGLTAVLHVPVGDWAYLAGEDQIHRSGQVWTTGLGSVVAPNAGITDHSVYITGQVVLWRAAAPWVTPVEAALDRAANEYRMLATRDYIAAWECFTAVVELGESE